MWLVKMPGSGVAFQGSDPGSDAAWAICGNSQITQVTSLNLHFFIYKTEKSTWTFLDLGGLEEVRSGTASPLSRRDRLVQKGATGACVALMTFRKCSPPSLIQACHELALVTGSVGTLIPGLQRQHVFLLMTQGSLTCCGNTFPRSWASA